MMTPPTTASRLLVKNGDVMYMATRLPPAWVALRRPVLTICLKELCLRRKTVKF